jgi:hypothetical protein
MSRVSIPAALAASVLTLALSLVPHAVAIAAMTPAYQATGNLGLEVVGLAGQNLPWVNGNLVLANMPPGAIVQKAYLYVSQINTGALNFDITLNGMPASAFLGPVSDPAFNTLYNFRFDVTSQVLPGNNSLVIGQQSWGSNIAGVGLAVVWSEPNEPQRTVSLIDGIVQVGESGAETESVQFASLPSGVTKAWVFTVYDDSMATGESVLYNNASIGGPIDQNLGPNASVLSMSTTSVSGANTMAISTGADHLAWMAAAVAIDHATVGVEPRSWGAVKGSYR